MNLQIPNGSSDSHLGIPLTRIFVISSFYFVIGAILYQTGQPLVIEPEIEVPALKRGQVLVDIAYSGVCHSQVMEARGHRGPDRFLPHLLGHEATGIVKEVGPEVTKVKVGEPVILGWIKGNGIEAGGAVYRCRGKDVNSGGVTTFSTQTIVSENRVVPLPKGLPMDVGVLFGCALLTGAGIVLNQIAPKENSSILVVGLGGIGLSALAACTLYKPSKLVAVDTNPEKLELAKSMGAHDVVLADRENQWMTTVKRIAGDKGFDYAIEAAGLVQTIESAFELTARGGKCVFASHPASGKKIQIDPFELICGKKIEGSWGGQAQPDRDVLKLSKLFLEGNLPLQRFFTKKYKLEDVNEALEDLENQKVIRPLLEINPALAAL